MSDGIHSEAHATLLNHRMTGQTTTCIGVLMQNPRARMVVHSMAMANDLARRYPLAKDRFVTTEQLQVGIRGFDGPLVYDTMAVIQLMGDSYRQGKTDALDKRKGQDYTKLMALQEVLQKLGDLTDSTIVAIPNK